MGCSRAMLEVEVEVAEAVVEARRGRLSLGEGREEVSLPAYRPWLEGSWEPMSLQAPLKELFLAALGSSPGTHKGPFSLPATSM